MTGEVFDDIRLVTTVIFHYIEQRQSRDKSAVSLTPGSHPIAGEIDQVVVSGARFPAPTALFFN